VAKNPFINDGSLENQRFLNRQQQQRARDQQAQADRNRRQDADRKARHKAMAEAWAPRPSSVNSPPHATVHEDGPSRYSNGAVGSTYQENKRAIWMIAILLFFFGFWLAESVLHFQNPYLQLGGGVVTALCAEAVFRFKRWIVGIGLILVAIYLYLHQGK
jgi:hypothetical protein